jgi:tetratricopeptide (TPR) repeat protein
MGGREVEVNYYIGLAYEALKNRSKANEFFKKSAQDLQARRPAAASQEPATNNVNVTSYYQALSLAKLGNTAQANKIFESMVSEANRQMGQSTEEVGAIFGRREAQDTRMTRLYTLRGLGYKGLGDLQKAKADLDKALELSQSNLNALVEKL